MALDRRAFVRRLGAATLGIPTGYLVGCTTDRPAPATGGSASAAAVGATLERPILLPWSEDVVRIASPLPELPMAYVSMGRREVYVDYRFRDRSNWVLDAHISVSTGLWRIPLPGDPEGQPITPGDLVREFEELDIAEWDPTMEPTLGDFRIRRGRPAPTRVHFACLPVGATDVWCSAGPWDVPQCEAVGEAACREDFVEVGVGFRHPIRGCEDDGEPIRFISWAATEE